MTVANCSTGSSELPPLQLGGDATGPSRTDAAPVDHELVQQTRVEIRRLVREITCLCQSDLAPQEFYQQFLDRVVSALAAVGGAVWLLDSQDQVRLHSQINLAETGIPRCDAAVSEHVRLLQQAARENRTTAVPPDTSSAADDASGNPTHLLLLLGPLVVDDQTRAVVEVFQRPAGGPVTHRGYLRFLAQMCDLANDFLKNRRLRVLLEEQQRWRDEERFLGTVHAGLDLTATAFAVANEGRRLLEVDRLSVLLRRGGRCDVLAISGVDSLQRRSDQVQSMARMAAVALRPDEPLWHPDDTPELAPEIEQVVQDHIDQSHARMVGVVPVRSQDSEDRSSGERGEVTIGVLVVEQFRDNTASPAVRRRAHQIARHAGRAMGNALAHERASAGLARRTLSRLRAAAGRSLTGRVLAGLLTLLLLATTLTCVPATLQISASGSLRPRQWRNVFAQLDGTVEDVFVRHGQHVQQGEILARLRNPELEMQIAALVGQKETLAEQILALQKQLLKDEQLSPRERSRLSVERAQLDERLNSVRRQLELQRTRQESLVVRSAVAGQIVTWDVDKTLANRPVQRGQVLMTVVDPTTDWELELLVEEQEAGHVVRASSISSPVNPGSEEMVPLPVTFTLSSWPGQQFTGRLVELDRTARQLNPSEQAMAARVRIDGRQLPDRRSGTTARARIDCGKYPLGYVWFRDVIEVVHREILSWL